MSNAELEAKFAQLVSPVLGAARVAPLVQACNELAACADLRVLTALSAPA
jgi:hypothetical protein